MEEIIIEFTGKYNLVLRGDLLWTNSDKINTIWKVQFINDNNNNEEVSIPSSSKEDKNGNMIVKIGDTQVSPTFWSINALDSEEDIYEIIVFPNEMDLTMFLRTMH